MHQREFVLQGGADRTSARLWPLSVDGLLLLATVGVLKPSHGRDRRTRAVMWLAFLLGVAVSLSGSIAAAPALVWKPVLVAGWPPVALLLAVELLARRSADEVRITAGDEAKPRQLVSQRAHLPSLEPEIRWLASPETASLPMAGLALDDSRKVVASAGQPALRATSCGRLMRLSSTVR
ncbi:DUF2637 domain-containing protein [Streptomyces sp. NPDC001107]